MSSRSSRAVKRTREAPPDTEQRLPQPKKKAKTATTVQPTASRSSHTERRQPQTRQHSPPNEYRGSRDTTDELLPAAAALRQDDLLSEGSADASEHEYSDYEDDHEESEIEDNQQEKILANAKRDVADPRNKHTIVEYLVDQVDIMRGQQDEIRANQDRMLKELLQMKRTLESIVSQRQDESPIPAHHIVNGQNVMLWAVRDGRAFALSLMDVIFKKEEMAGHLCFISAAGRKRTNKATLPTEKVQKIVKLVMERYPSMDMKVLKDVMNQKCRDSARDSASRRQNDTHSTSTQPAPEPDDLSNA